MAESMMTDANYGTDSSPAIPTDKAKVLVLYVGGTIGMKPSDNGYVPSKDYLVNYLFDMPVFHNPLLPKTQLAFPVFRYNKTVLYDIKQYDPLLDSSNMSQSDWLKIATDVEAHHDTYDGFVILHGTDTMAYTAAGLSFLLHNLRKPVILTGAQIPISQPKSDAIDNFMGSLTIAGVFQIPEVCIFFDNKLLRGNRALKYSSTDFDAFQSPNMEPLATVGVDIKVNWKDVLPYPEEYGNLNPMRAGRTLCPDVAALHMFPGITATIIRNFLAPPLKGLVLMGYGTGNIPVDTQPEILQTLREAAERGVIIVTITQCFKGRAEPNYATGKALVDNGVVCGRDMSCEAAIAKLSYLLAEYSDPDVIKTKLEVPLRGEMEDINYDRRRRSVRSVMFTEAVLMELEKFPSEEALSHVPFLVCSTVAGGLVEAVKRLLAHWPDAIAARDYDKRTPLHIAAARGDLNMVKFLCDRGACVLATDTFGLRPVDEAKRHAHVDVEAYLASRGAGY